MAHFIDEIRNRRVLPAVGVYAAGCWVLIEILDRLVSRYLLSPYITDAAFWGLYSMIPAVILVAWSHGKPGKDKVTTAEKVGIPINLIATIGLLVTVFGGKDMGLTAKAMTLANEEGVVETHYVPKEAYRRRMAVFFFDNISGDETFDWLQYGVTELIVQDLQQSPFISANSPWANYANGYYARMRAAGFEDGLDIPRSLMREIADDANRQYFVDGTIDHRNGEYVVTARIWKTDTLEQVDALSESGLDLYGAIDRLTVRVREALDVPAGNKRVAEDLPLSETYGESEAAFKAYIAGLNERLFTNDITASNAFLDQAIEADPGFVLAWFVKALNLVESGDVPAAQAAIAKAQELNYRLPARDQASLKQVEYRLSGQQDKLITFLRLQVQLRGDASSHQQLANMLLITGELEEAKEEYRAALEQDALNLAIYLQLSVLERATGDRDAAIAYARKYQQEKPEDPDAQLVLGDLLRDSGELDAANEHYLNASLLGNEPVVALLRMAELSARRGDIAKARDFIEQADAAARTPLHKSLVLGSAAMLEIRLGRLQAAIEQLYRREGFLNQSMAPYQAAMSSYVPIATLHADLGELDLARAAVDKAVGMIQPPLNQIMGFPMASILAMEGDFAAAERELQKAIDFIDQFKIEDLRVQADMTRASIETAAKRYQDAVRDLQSARKRVERSVLAGNDLFTQLPEMDALTALAMVHADQAEEAEHMLDHGFRLDPANPLLWLARARRQQAAGANELALASVNYALAIWKEADTHYRFFRQARELADELRGSP